MMQKGFIFLLLFWNSSPFAPGNTTNLLQFSLGCIAVIPCQKYRSDLSPPRWFYQTNTQQHKKPIKIYSQDNNGLDIYDQVFRQRTRVQRNGSLVISNFTENDQGFYWCEHCFQGHCQNKQHTGISVKKEILQETHKTVYVIAGSTFTHACPGELINLKWTLRGSQSDFVTFNKSIHIGNVKSADAGEYTCLKKGCKGPWQNLLRINLCVITVHNNEDSSVSCAVMCGAEFSHIKLNGTFIVETGTQIILMLVHPNGSLNCTAKQKFNGNSTVNSTHGPSTALNKTTGIPTKRAYLIPVAIGTPAAFTFLILIVLLICYLKPRLHAVGSQSAASSGLVTHVPPRLCVCFYLFKGLPVPLCCSCLNGRMEEETAVVYSSIIIRTPAKTRDNQMTYSDNSCVYSEIKVERTNP